MVYRELNTNLSKVTHLTKMNQLTKEIVPYLLDLVSERESREIKMTERWEAEKTACDSRAVEGE